MVVPAQPLPLRDVEFTVGILVALVAVVGIVAAVVVVRRGRAVSAPETTAVDSTPRTLRPEPAPMTDLEAALAQVTDRSGRPIGESIDAEAGIVDELRDGDDTGPLLGRALDAIDRSTPRPADTDPPTGDAGTEHA